MLNLHLSSREKPKLQRRFQARVRVRGELVQHRQPEKSSEARRYVELEEDGEDKSLIRINKQRLDQLVA